MAIETVTLVVGQEWTLLSAAAAGPFEAQSGRLTNLVFFLGNAAPAADYKFGLSRSSMSFPALSAKVWARSIQGPTPVTVVRTVDAGNVAEVMLPAVGLSALSFSAGLAAGADIATITGRVAGDKVEALSSTDGRIALSSDRTKLVRGLADIAAGTLDVEITTSHPLAPNSPKSSKLTLTATAAPSVGGGVLVTVPTNAIIIGDTDSTMAGQQPGGGSGQAIQSVIAKLTDLFVAQGIAATDETLFGDHGSWGTAQGIANFAAGDARFAYAGAWNLGATKVAGGNGFYINAAGSMTFTPRRPVNKYDIYWLDQTGTGRNLKASAGASGDVALNTTGTSALIKTTVNAGSLGIHPLTIAYVAGGGSHVLGVVGYNDTAPQLRLYNWAISGATFAIANDNTNTPVSRQASSAFYGVDLSIIQGMINDPRQNTALATAKAGVTTRVQTGLATKAGAKVLLVTPVHDPSSTGNAPNQELYVTAMKEVAAEQGVPILDIRPMWQSHAYAVSQGWAVQGDVHPTAAGYAAMAQWVRSAIGVTA